MKLRSVCKITRWAQFGFTLSGDQHWWDRKINMYDNCKKDKSTERTKLWASIKVSLTNNNLNQAGELTESNRLTTKLRVPDRPNENWMSQWSKIGPSRCWSLSQIIVRARRPWHWVRMNCTVRYHEHTIRTIAICEQQDVRAKTLQHHTTIVTTIRPIIKEIARDFVTI